MADPEIQRLKAETATFLESRALGDEELEVVDINQLDNVDLGLVVMDDQTAQVGQEGGKSVNLLDLGEDVGAVTFPQSSKFSGFSAGSPQIDTILSPVPIKSSGIDLLGDSGNIYDPKSDSGSLPVLEPTVLPPFSTLKCPSMTRPEPQQASPVARPSNVDSK